MAEVVISEWHVSLSELVVIPYGHATARLVRHRNIELFEAGHPIPDQYRVLAARHKLELVQDVNANYLVLALIVGGE